MLLEVEVVEQEVVMALLLLLKVEVVEAKVAIAVLLLLLALSLVVKWMTVWKNDVNTHVCYVCLLEQQRRMKAMILMTTMLMLM
jgi:hypothetical protein